MSGQSEFLKLSWKVLKIEFIMKMLTGSWEPLLYTKFNMSPCFTRFYWQGRKLKHLTSFTSPNCFPPLTRSTICPAVSFINILVIVTVRATHSQPGTHIFFAKRWSGYWGIILQSYSHFLKACEVLRVLGGKGASCLHNYMVHVNNADH